MCGYTDYNDPRLQPPEDGGEDMTPAECWARCVHGDACMGLLMRLEGELPKHDRIARAAEMMGCEDCGTWEGME
jgi:hypothetical protein